MRQFYTHTHTHMIVSGAEAILVAASHPLLTGGVATGLGLIVPKSMVLKFKSNLVIYLYFNIEL